MKKPVMWIEENKQQGIATLWVYGMIGGDSEEGVQASNLVRELNWLSDNYGLIKVRINSLGGNVWEGITIYNAMRQCKARVETYIDGVAASMASIIALGGGKCYMASSARIMTHQPRLQAGGTREDLENGRKLLEGIEATMLGIYASKTKKTEEECRTLLMPGEDKWITAQEALELGLVDEIYDGEPVEVAAEADVAEVWASYNDKLRHSATHQSTHNMKQYHLTAATLTAMGLTAEAGDSAIEAKISDLVARAANADQYKRDLDASLQKLADIEAAARTEKVTTLVNAAIGEKKITVEMAAQLKADYAEKPEALEALLNTMQPIVSVTAQLQKEGTADEALLTMSYGELDKKGLLPKLKETNLDVFKAKYKEHFGTEYGN